MARGKASVQLYDNAGGDLVRMFDHRADLVIMTGNSEPARRQGDAQPTTELGEQIVGQLRVAYDELLNEPIPDHLKRLLDDLCKAEGRS